MGERPCATGQAHGRVDGCHDYAWKCNCDTGSIGERPCAAGQAHGRVDGCQGLVGVGLPDILILQPSLTLVSSNPLRISLNNLHETSKGTSYFTNVYFYKILSYLVGLEQAPQRKLSRFDSFFLNNLLLFSISPPFCTQFCTQFCPTIPTYLIHSTFK